MRKLCLVPVVATLWVAQANAATLQVGPDKPYGAPCAAIAAAAANDVIEVDASGDYAGDHCQWSTDGLTVRGVGGRAVMDMTGVTPSNGKGTFVILAANATIENMEFTGVSVGDQNGAGIRHQGLNLTVRNCYFHDNDDGILGSPLSSGTPAPNQGNVLIESSEFFRNGFGDGQSHNMYLGDYQTVTVQYSYSHGAKVGQLLKTRAFNNYILYNRLTTEDGTASYELDFSNGGVSYVIGNYMQQGDSTENRSMVTYGPEGLHVGSDNHLFMMFNTLVNERTAGATFVKLIAGAQATIKNNIFVGPGDLGINADTIEAGNWTDSDGDPQLLDQAGFDYRLAATSPCIDKAVAVESDEMAIHHYVHPLGQEGRVVAGAAADLGAFEVGGGGGPGPSDGGMSGDGGGDNAAGDNGGGCCGTQRHPHPVGTVIMAIGLLGGLSRRRR